MFKDQATINVIGGHGGRGCVSWRREKYIPKGGPDGGNGGKGGDVYIIADENSDTLSDYLSRKKFVAAEGRFGEGQKRNGRGGEDLYLKVPPGTLVSEAFDKTLLADLESHGDQVLIAHGGRGGYGNAHFKSSVRQKPDFAELGEEGEEIKVHLELKLVADVGIIGYPSVGKSTLISVISSAKPKIADYPFTTLVPNLGVVNVDDRSYIVCDVPGLIEGASEGKGLGDTFLKHIERCGILLHMLDLSRALDAGTVNVQKLVDDYKAIRKELENYSPALATKKELIVLNKTDIVQDDIQKVTKELQSKKIPVFASISAATHQGTDDLMKKLLPLVLDERKKRSEETAEEEKVILQPHLISMKMGVYRIQKEEDGSIRVIGKRLEQLTNMTDFSSQGAVKRFRDVLERVGLIRAIRKEQAGEATDVFIGDRKITDYL